MRRYEIIDKLNGALDELFHDYQEDSNIESGDLCPELTDKLDLATHRLADVIQMCMAWQKDNCPTVKYEQTYAPDTDTTFIMKVTCMWNDIVRREVVGFYSGEPTGEDFETYKNQGTVAEY